MQVLKGLVKLGLRTEVTAAALLDAAQGLHDAAEPAEEHSARAAALLHQLNAFAAQGELPHSAPLPVAPAICTADWRPLVTCISAVVGLEWCNVLPESPALRMWISTVCVRRPVRA